MIEFKLVEVVLFWQEIFCIWAIFVISKSICFMRLCWNKVVVFLSILVSKNAIISIYSYDFGGVAQLVARLNGIQKVVGSTPIVSTKF